MNKPIKHDIEILQEYAGLRKPRPWGAAVGASLEWLRGHHYMDGNTITEKGHGLLEGWEACSTLNRTHTLLLADYLAQIAQALCNVKEPFEQAAQSKLCEVVEDLKLAANGDAAALARLRQESKRGH